MAEDDWDGWSALTARSATACSSSATTCSSPTRRSCAEGIDAGIANSILIKLNQIGTLTETLDAIELGEPPATRASSRTAPARPRTRPSPTSRWRPTPARSRPARRRARDRMAKYNQLLRIEEELGDRARFAGQAAFAV